MQAENVSKDASWGGIRNLEPAGFFIKKRP